MNKKITKIFSALFIAIFGLISLNPNVAKADPNVLPFPYTLQASNITATSVVFNGKISTTQGTDSMIAYFKYFEVGQGSAVEKTWNREYSSWDVVNGYITVSDSSVTALKPNTTYAYYLEIGYAGQYITGDFKYFTTPGSYSPTPNPSPITTPEPVVPAPVIPAPTPIIPEPTPITQPQPTPPIYPQPIVQPTPIAQPVVPISPQPIVQPTPIVQPQPVAPISPTTPIQPTVNYPQVQTLYADNITATSARLNGNLLNLGGANYADVWFEWNNEGKTSWIPLALADNGATGIQSLNSVSTFSSVLNNLQPNTTYYFRAVARNNAGNSFGTMLSFRTLDNNQNQNQNRLTLTSSARDVSQNSQWSKNLYTKPSSVVNIRIEISNDDTKTYNNLTVADILPLKTKYVGNLQVDGTQNSTDIISGLNIGDLNPGQRKTITFDIIIDPIESFNYGQNQLRNSAVIKNIDPEISDTITLYIDRSGVAGTTTSPSNVSTGFGNTIKDYIYLPIFIIVLALVVFRKHFVYAVDAYEKIAFASRSNSEKFSQSFFGKKSESELEKAIKRLNK